MGDLLNILTGGLSWFLSHSRVALLVLLAVTWTDFMGLAVGVNPLLIDTGATSNILADLVNGVYGVTVGVLSSFTGHDFGTSMLGWVAGLFNVTNLPDGSLFAVVFLVFVLTLMRDLQAME